MTVLHETTTRQFIGITGSIECEVQVVVVSVIDRIKENTISPSLAVSPECHTFVDDLSCPYVQPYDIHILIHFIIESGIM